MSSSLSPSTPKRKREPIPTPPEFPPNMRLTTNIPSGSFVGSNEERAGSPRTKVSYTFEGLHLGETPGVSFRPPRLAESNVTDEVSTYESAVRKRLKVLGAPGMVGPDDEDKEIPETPASKSFQIMIGPERKVDPFVEERAKNVVLHNRVDPMIFHGNAAPALEIDRFGKRSSTLDEQKAIKPRNSKNKSRTPLFVSAETNLEESAPGRVTDKERASNTWHDYEITGHNPDDPDDDGEGINGIGFRPTPAIAHARAEKRRLQLAEYRNREAREARAKRSERRKGMDMTKASREEAETARRVRFLEESERNSFVPSPST